MCCERWIHADSTMLYRRWRMTLRSRPAGAGSKPPQAAGVKSPGGERCGKRRKQFRQVWLKETNVSEPLKTCRNISNRRRNRDLDFYPASKGWERPAYCPTGVRHEGGVTLGRASGKEHRNLSFRCEGRNPSGPLPQVSEYRCGAQGRRCPY